MANKITAEYITNFGDAHLDITDSEGHEHSLRLEAYELITNCGPNQTMQFLPDLPEYQGLEDEEVSLKALCNFIEQYGITHIHCSEGDSVQTAKQFKAFWKHLTQF